MSKEIKLFIKIMIWFIILDVIGVFMALCCISEGKYRTSNILAFPTVVVAGCEMIGTNNVEHNFVQLKSDVDNLFINDSRFNKDYNLIIQKASGAMQGVFYSQTMTENNYTYVKPLWEIKIYINTDVTMKIVIDDNQYEVIYKGVEKVGGKYINRYYITIDDIEINGTISNNSFVIDGSEEQYTISYYLGSMSNDDWNYLAWILAHEINHGLYPGDSERATQEHTFDILYNSKKFKKVALVNGIQSIIGINNAGEYAFGSHVIKSIW